MGRTISFKSLLSQMVRVGFASDLALKGGAVTLCYNARRFEVLRDLFHAVKRETGADGY
jgi:hypothetical protein